MWSRRLCSGALAVAMIAIASACGAGDGTTAGRRSTAVSIDTFAFTPEVVHIAVGDRVTWTNHDDIAHTVTSGTREYEAGNSGHVVATHHTGVFDDRLDGRAATATVTFATAGTYHYFCDRHPGMEGDIDVS